MKRPRKRKSRSKIQNKAIQTTHWSDRYRMSIFRIEPRIEAVAAEVEILPRINQSRMEPDKREQFVKAFKYIITNGQFADLVSIHSDAATYRIHTERVDTDTNQRFLPWHRVFLHELETRLNSTPQGNNIRIPYWDWTVDRDIPDWINGFRPTIENVAVFPLPAIPPPPHVPVIQTIHVERNPGRNINPRTGRPFELPTQVQVTDILSSQTFRQFTAKLENYHGLPHLWVGGTMETYVSPADPLFWLHHSNIDRIWSVWPCNQTKLPDLHGSDTELKPWSYKTDENPIQDSKFFGYIYE
jgi:tyrosinase